jgi:transglutaminase-like putative cysteine protease/tetratricopeptide (TPR) repeat protein
MRLGLPVLVCIAANAISVDRAIASAQKPAELVISSEAGPGWLARRELPEATAERVAGARDGVVYLMTDWQVRGNDTGYDSYYRLAVKVVNRSGLEEAGKLSFALDPRIESMALNFVHVIRDGKVIDRTADAQFSVVERETDLSDGIVTGNLQAISNLKDIRVGDIVDYGMIRHVRTTLWPGHYFTTFTDRFSEPLALRAIRIQWPKARPLTLRSTRTDISFEQRDSGALREWEWIGVDRPSARGEDDVPAWIPQYGRVDISSMTNWRQVAQWAAPLYAGKDGLPAEFERRLAEIGRRWSDPADRITEMTRYIQDNIRYVGEELGEGSYVPRPPALVIERGYGDCKDKSLLLVTALRRLGIDAVPALVSTTPGIDLPDRLPSPSAFDHVIVRVVLGDRVLWLDPTGSHRGGRGVRLVSSDLGYALPIREDQAGLEKMEGYAAVAGAVDVVESFEIDEQAPAAMKLRVETRYSDAEADSMRARLATRANTGIAHDNLTFYQNRFPGLVESSPLQLRDDRDANAFVMIENYTLSKPALDEAKTLSAFKTTAYLVRDLIPGRQTAPRREPLRLPTHVKRTQTIEVTAKGRAPGTADDLEKHAGDLWFSRKTDQAGERWSVRYELKTGAQAMVPADGAEAVYAVSDAIGDESVLVYALAKAGKPSANADIIASDAIKPFRADLERVGAMMQTGDQSKLVEALALINGIAGKIQRPSPAAGLVDGMKGAILSGLNRRPAALTALSSSIEQYQGNAEIMQLLIAYQIDARDVPGALKTMAIALKSQPAILTAFNPDWVRMINTLIRALPAADRQPHREDLCIILSSGGWGVAPRTVEGNQFLECAAEARIKRGQLAEARAILAKGLPADALAGLAIDRRFQAIWPDLEAEARTGFKSRIDEDIASAARAAKDAPEDFAAMTRYVRALRVAGRADEAVKAGQALAGRRDKIEASGEPAFWYINEYAYALAQAGQVDAAIGRMDALLALGVDTYPELVSQVINRSEMLNQWGRHDLAYAALVEAEEKYAKHASLYGKKWMWAGKACALRELGRGGEADLFDKQLAGNPEENRAAMSMAAACRGDEKMIEALLIVRLDDPETRNDVLGGFLQFRKESGSPFEIKLRRIVDRVRARPSLQAKLTQYGRSVPYAGTRSYWGDY